jgi:hypothetical protein
VDCFVIRLQDDNNVGPYNSGHDPAWDRRDFTYKNHPTIGEDEILCEVVRQNNWSEWSLPDDIRFGFSSVQQMLSWFYRAEHFRYLALAEFKVVVYRVRSGSAWHGKAQCVFELSSAEVSVL